MFVCTVVGQGAVVEGSEVSEHRSCCSITAHTWCTALSSCCRAVLMLLPRHLTHSQEFKGSRENPGFLLQLKSTVSRNLESIVTHKLYQILGVEKAKARAVFPHPVFALDTVPRY